MKRKGRWQPETGKTIEVVSVQPMTDKEMEAFGWMFVTDKADGGRHSCCGCGSQFPDTIDHKGQPIIYCPFCRQENINFISYRHQRD